MTLKVNYMNFPQEKLIGSNEFDLASLGGCTEKPVEVELKNKTDSGEDQVVGKLNLTVSIGKSITQSECEFRAPF